jgi:CheY-like chemotaxis protein
MSNIVIVEQNQVTHRAISEALNLRGHHTRIVSDSAEALNEIKMATPDLILLDIALPNVSGYQIIESLQADPDAKHIPVMLMNMEQMFDTDAPNLIKPVDTIEVANMISTLLVEKLPDDQIFQLANLKLGNSLQEELNVLLDRNAEGELEDLERARLDALMDEYGIALWKKSEALRVAVERKLIPPLA